MAARGHHDCAVGEIQLGVVPPLSGDRLPVDHLRSSVKTVPQPSFVPSQLNLPLTTLMPNFH